MNAAHHELAQIQRMKDEQLPKLVLEALARFKMGESVDSAIAWTWHRAETDDRLAIDKWIVDTRHPTAMLPGTREWRFRVVVREQLELLYINDRGQS